MQNGLPVFVWELMRGMTLLNAAAVQQNVDSMTVFQDGGDESRYRGIGGEVYSVDSGFAAEGLDGLFCLLVGGVALEGVSGL